jgi:hypothetical protein
LHKIYIRQFKPFYGLLGGFVDFSIYMKYIQCTNTGVACNAQTTK